MPNVIVTGFEPFGGKALNRSWEVVRRLPARPELETLQLPVNYAELELALPELAKRRPRALLLVGEASTSVVRVEQIALNAVDTGTPDNAGYRPGVEAIDAGGPLALRSRWDARQLARGMVKSGVKAEASFHAGTYACNFSLYLALRAMPGKTPVGFLHVPHGVRTPGLRNDDLLRAVELAIKALAPLA